MQISLDFSQGISRRYQGTPFKQGIPFILRIFTGTQQRSI
jgi:hypothetical protein